MTRRSQFCGCTDSLRVLKTIVNTSDPYPRTGSFTSYQGGKNAHTLIMFTGALI
jgi:hypothetical protein